MLFIWLIVLGYVTLMLVYKKGWHMQDDFVIHENYLPQTAITVIIPARNEENSISKCVQSILDNDYPEGLFEIIVMDDHSSDNTVDLVKGFNRDNVRCLRLADFLKEGEQLNSYKKKGIEIAIAYSTGELIITTDADCIVPEHWLRNMASMFEKEKSVMIVAPVAFTSDGSLLQAFQSIDFMTMQGITAAAHRLKLGNMSNGANLAYSKEAFYKVEGFKGADHLASGDDYLLMVKMQKEFSGKIAYLKSQDSIVETTPQPDWKGFLNQRIRWASKTGKYDDKKLTAILMLVYLFNLSFLILLIAGFGNSLFWILGIGFLLIKISAELFFLIPVAAFFNKKRELFWFPFLQPMHIVYIIISGFLGFIGVYQWKGRRVK